jgi:hypothetical protein
MPNRRSMREDGPESSGGEAIIPATPPNLPSSSGEAHGSTTITLAFGTPEWSHLGARSYPRGNAAAGN